MLNRLSLRSPRNACWSYQPRPRTTRLLPRCLPPSVTSPFAQDAPTSSTSEYDLEGLETPSYDAFQELVRMAVAKDPSLATLAAQQLSGTRAGVIRAPAEAAARSPSRGASAMLGPNVQQVRGLVHAG